ncbi:hypothetical protein NVP1022O_41 [Vibrio phage 1.022.O._10N.286.45.A10]|nr:hypothetical protein NVP1022O_41 [Vibrio phage 1.022.O._10N.286.45.A10]
MEHFTTTNTVHQFTFSDEEAQYLANLVQNNLLGEPEDPRYAEFRKKLFEAIRPPMSPPTAPTY